MYPPLRNMAERRRKTTLSFLQAPIPKATTGKPSQVQPYRSTQLFKILVLQARLFQKSLRIKGPRIASRSLTFTQETPSFPTTIGYTPVTGPPPSAPISSSRLQNPSWQLPATAKKSSQSTIRPTCPLLEPPASTSLPGPRP